LATFYIDKKNQSERLYAFKKKYNFNFKKGSLKTKFKKVALFVVSYCTNQV
jgi:hypothetical protein